MWRGRFAAIVILGICPPQSTRESLVSAGVLSTVKLLLTFWLWVSPGRSRGRGRGSRGAGLWRRWWHPLSSNKLHIGTRKVTLLLSRLVEPREPADLGRPFLSPAGAAQGQEGSPRHHQDVSDMEVYVLLPLLLIVIQSPVLVTFSTHLDIFFALSPHCLNEHWSLLPTLIANHNPRSHKKA